MEFVNKFAIWESWNHQPDRTVEDKGFRDMVESISYQIYPVSRKSIYNKLNEMFECAKKNQLRERFASEVGC